MKNGARLSDNDHVHGHDQLSMISGEKFECSYQVAQAHYIDIKVTKEILRNHCKWGLMFALGEEVDWDWL